MSIPKRKWPEPTPSYVRSRLEESKTSPWSADTALNLVFNQWPTNTELSHVLTKVVLLNRLYSTNIFAVETVANHIYQLGVDPRLEAGDALVVDSIARVSLSTGFRRFYSFATKFCAWHQPALFQIYDSYIEDLLWKYSKQFGFAKYPRDSTSDYSKFLNVIDAFRAAFRLEDFTRKEVDKFLWVEAQTQTTKQSIPLVP